MNPFLILILLVFFTIWLLFVLATIVAIWPVIAAGIVLVWYVRLRRERRSCKWHRSVV